MKRSLPYILMTAGAVPALVFAAGPMGESRSLQIGFVLCIGLIALGAWLRRSTGKSRSEGDAGSNEFGRAVLAMEQLVSDSRVRPASREEWKSVLNRLHQASESVVEHRQVMLDRFGVSTYAQIMTTFARAERAINRCQSALSDGYPQEADDRYADIHEAALQARKLMRDE